MKKHKNEDHIKDHIKENDRPFLISVLGVGHGCGTTHTAIVLGNYYSNALGLRTAVVELNHNNDFMKIRKMAEQGQGERYAFTVNTVDFYAKVDEEQLVRIYEKDYEVIVLDLAYQEKEEHAEIMSTFHRSDFKIAMVGMELWKYEDAKVFLINESEHIHRMKFWSLSYNKDIAELIRREMGIRVEQILYEPDPMYITSEHLRWYKEHME